MQQNLDLIDPQSPLSYMPSQKSAASQRQYEYQLSQYRMLEMQSNLLYSTKEDGNSPKKGLAKTFNKAHELKSLVSPEINGGASEMAQTRKREVNLPRRRSPVVPEPDPKDLKTTERNEMRSVFNEWLQYMRGQKQKWARLIRFRYLLSRMKQNRILLQWKAQIRKKKVQRLRYTIISHQHYRMVMQQCILEWQESTKQQKRLKQGLISIKQVLVKKVVQYAFGEIKNEARRTESLR